MTGFFTKQETHSESIQAKQKKLSCYSCGLYKGEIDSPKMQPTGNFKKGIMNIGEFTNSQDDNAGKPFQGRDHSVYEIYEKLGIDIEEDCININSVMCHTYDKKTLKSRSPLPKEIDCCRIHVLRYIEQYKPKLIVLFGKTALTSVIGELWKDSLDSIDKWRGFVIPDQRLQCWIAPVYSPSYVRIMAKEHINLIWEQDLKNALDTMLYTKFPIYKEPNITVLTDLKRLKEIQNHTTIAFDYETTGLKPHSEGHRIVCASVAVDEDNVFVFEMPKKALARKPFVDLMKNPYIKKMAHNIKFEDTWTLVKLKTRIKNWFWCSMQAAHILDNRQGVTGLKFQTYINFGVAGYNETVKSWIQGADQKNANSKNKMIEYMATPTGKKETLKYCALDSIFEYRLAMKQMYTIKDKTLPF